ncbi:hypothetical protein C1X89_32915 [Pseudomonas sp. GP01-A8]|nr:hypothetical protein C1X89_32915 [Pseudomonas sp. GP01-A8]PMU32477.1 hypothetical protein C1X88_01150 [Pseudomonas sp. GP01-A13]
MARELALARGLAPAGVRSAPGFFGAATQPSGSKLPRHRGLVQIYRVYVQRPSHLSPAGHLLQRK